MEARELRLDNYVNDTLYGTEVQVTLQHFKEDAFYLLQPIEITEDWLLKLGFKDGNEYINTRNHWTKGNFGIKKCFWADEKPTFHLFSTPNGELAYYRHGKIPTIDSVHQLQNVYFALTGEELEAKDETK